MASRQLGRGAPRQLKKGPRPKIELLPRRLNLFLGDAVEVVDGRYDLGKQGKVIKIDREKQQIFVKGVREVTRRVAAREGNPGGTLVRELPIHYSNVALVDPVNQTPTKVKWMRNMNNKLVRVARSSGAIVPVPRVWLENKPQIVDGAKDTKASAVFTKTYTPSLETFEKAVLAARREAFKKAFTTNA